MNIGYSHKIKFHLQISSFNYVLHKLFAQIAKKKNSLVNTGIRVLIFLKEKGVGSLVI